MGGVGGPETEKPSAPDSCGTSSCKYFQSGVD
eukprot:CAMPEP_0203921796 /NCGR_PEP_ID=MMETSP0359-20131031/61905_1 /ASSEMBLY_ACC=CAM_ASM_000338 /TAXON_ID=268821 /ORGANISM="Scrippsiella Hangoei, Strain SHTV-5" /LENGTH=31 /DNA_ID= /DNA_START= /DNA_END= /DNA_ORIENTATION=